MYLYIYINSKTAIESYTQGASVRVGGTGVVRWLFVLETGWRVCAARGAFCARCVHINSMTMEGIDTLYV